jgi:4-amino-4-deoxy-L-arabinose transferase-like glycosyltransferase
MQSILASLPSGGDGRHVAPKPQSASADRHASSSPHAWLALLAVMAIGLLARLHNLGEYSLWRDEGYSARAITHSYFFQWRILPRFEFTPPGYYLILKAWTELAGNSEFALRLPSVLFNVATIPVVFLIGRMLGCGPKGSPFNGLLAAVLFTLSALQLQYAQDARCYTLLVFVVSMAILTALRIMREGDPGPIPVKRWLPLGVLLGLIPWIHYTGALAVITLAAALAYWWYAAAHRDLVVLKGLLLAAAVSLLVVLPNLLSLLGRAADVYKGYWITKPGLGDIVGTVLQFSGTAFTGTREVIFLLFLGLSILGLRDLRANGKAMAAVLLVCVGLLPPLMEIVISYIAMPVFLERTLLYASIPLSVLVGRGAESLRGRRRVLCIISLVGLLGINATGYLANAYKESWKDAVAYLNANMRPGEPVFYTNTSAGWAMAYYIERTRAGFVSHGVPFRSDDFGFAERDDLLLPDTGRQVNAQDIARVRQLMAGARRIGVVLWDSSRSDPGRMLMSEVEKEFRPVDEKKIAGMVILILDRR